MYKLLIVDDDPGIREGIAEGLQGIFEVGQAPGGAEALASVEADRPDVVLLDQNMAGLTGTRVLEHMGEKGWRPAVVMFSATMDVSLVRRALKLGAQDCVAKPFLLDDLRQKLEHAAQTKPAAPGEEKPFGARVAELLCEEIASGGGERLDARSRQFARQLLAEALHDCEGDVDLAAERLGVGADEFRSAYQSLNRGDHTNAQQHPSAG